MNSDNHDIKSLGKIKNTVNVLEELIDSIQNRSSENKGASTSFNELSDIFENLNSGEITVIASRPSMGKSALALQLAEMTLGKGLPVIIFSMEMSAQVVMARLISSFAQIPYANLISGSMTEHEWTAFMYTVEFLQGVPLYIQENDVQSPELIENTCHYISKKHENLGLIIVDCIQMVKIPNIEHDRTGELQEVSRYLKTLARKMDCPVLVTSHVNKNVVSRPDKMPSLLDISGSDTIVQYADMVMFIHRDEYYYRDKRHHHYNEIRYQESMGKAEIMVAKNRNGNIGRLNLQFIEEYMKFDDVVFMDINGQDD